MLYTIGDLHLSFEAEKPMDVFGSGWTNYVSRIEKGFSSLSKDDLCVICGDLSWSMSLEKSLEDFKFINNLPGKKIILKGNHDYWWSTVTSMRKYIKEKNFENIDFLINNSYEFENKIIVGTRGWALTEDAEDKRLTQREVARLELSIKSGIEQYGTEKEIIAFMHYPTITKNNLNTEYIKILKKYNIKRCF